MTPEKRLERHTKEAAKVKLNTWRDRVARDLQKAIRAEAGAFVGYVACVEAGEVVSRYSPLGMVRCVTCAKLLPWSDRGTDAGHFLPSRNAFIVLEEVGIHSQCYACNGPQGGATDRYSLYMHHVYGAEVVEELRRRKRGWTIRDGEQVRLEPHTKHELTALRIPILDRIKAATDIIKRGMESC